VNASDIPPDSQVYMGGEQFVSVSEH